MSQPNTLIMFKKYYKEPYFCLWVLCNLKVAEDASLSVSLPFTVEMYQKKKLADRQKDR